VEDEVFLEEVQRMCEMPARMFARLQRKMDGQAMVEEVRLEELQVVPGLQQMPSQVQSKV